MIKLLDKVTTINSKVGERRCILTKDEHQWILITGAPHATEADCGPLFSYYLRRPNERK